MVVRSAPITFIDGLSNKKFIVTGARIDKKQTSGKERRCPVAPASAGQPPSGVLKKSPGVIASPPPAGAAAGDVAILIFKIEGMGSFHHFPHHVRICLINATDPRSPRSKKRGTQ